MTARWIFLGLLLLYLAAGIWTTRRANATGDEPYYFMAADALLRGEGVELTARWRDLASSSYDPGPPVTEAELARQSAPSAVRDGRYPLHDLALSLLVAIPFALGGRALVVVLSAVAMAAALALAYRTAVGSGIGSRAAAAGAVIAGLAAPAVTYSGQTFPDAIAPLPVALAIAASRGVVPFGWAGAAVAALPLLHLRLWPLALGLLALVVPRRPTGRVAATLAGPLVGAVVALAAVGLVVYGVPVPHASYVTFFASGHSVPSYVRPDGGGLLGLFADRTFGLLPAAPVYALAFVGAGIAMREPRVRGPVAAAVPYVVTVAFLDWTGAFSPQARYLAPLVPVLAYLLAIALERRAAALAAAPLVLLTLAQSAVFVVAPELRYGRAGSAPLWDQAWETIGVRPSAAFPSLTADGSAALIALWAALLAALVAVGAMRHRDVTARADRGSAWVAQERSWR